MKHEHYSILKPRPTGLQPTDKDYRDSPKKKSQIIDDEVIEPHSDDPIPHQKPLVVSGMARSQTLHSLSASSTSSADSILLHESAASQLDVNFSSFGMDLRRETHSSPDVPFFDKGTRRVMEPHLRKARLLREKARSRNHNLIVHHSIASSVGVPYVRLRSETPFLFDIHTHPIHEVLTETLAIQDLSRIHEEGDLHQLMEPLRTKEGRRLFQEAYDNFVTSFCIPLLHSMGMAKNIFHAATDSSSISYRYQAFPGIRVVRPGETSEGPKCDTANGHSVGFLHFHVPLTASFGTNALYTECHPGREDWHPLIAKSVGLGFLFDGARCLHFNMENTTDSSCVALDFVVAIYGDSHAQDYVDGDSLCNRTILEDQFSVAGPGYYDEAVIDVGLGSPQWQIVAKKYGNHLLDPDHRVGFPFV